MRLGGGNTFMAMPELLKQRGMLSDPWACPRIFCGARCDPRPVLPFLVRHFTHCTVCLTSVSTSSVRACPAAPLFTRAAPAAERITAAHASHVLLTDGWVPTRSWPAQGRHNRAQHGRTTPPGRNGRPPSSHASPTRLLACEYVMERPVCAPPGSRHA